MTTAPTTEETLERFRLDVRVVPVDAALHRVLAACHRRQLTIDSLHYTRSPSIDLILMEVVIAPNKASVITSMLQREPLVICCTAARVDPSPAAPLAP